MHFTLLERTFNEYLSRCRFLVQYRQCHHRSWFSLFCTIDTVTSDFLQYDVIVAHACLQSEIHWPIRLHCEYM